MVILDEYPPLVPDTIEDILRDAGDRAWGRVMDSLDRQIMIGDLLPGVGGITGTISSSTDPRMWEQKSAAEILDDIRSMIGIVPPWIRAMAKMERAPLFIPPVA